MYTIKKLKSLKDNDGATLKNYNEVSYKTGYQVATSGVECKDAESAMDAIKKFSGNAGVWYSNGVYYIDKSKRIATLKKACFIGKIRKQQSILKWSDKSLIWLSKGV